MLSMVGYEYLKSCDVQGPGGGKKIWEWVKGLKGRISALSSFSPLLNTHWNRKLIASGRHGWTNGPGRDLGWDHLSIHR